MSTPLCDICGKPATQYPNWILSHGEQMHVGCMASNRRDLLASMKTIAYEPIGHSEASLREVYDGIVVIARSAVARAKGQQ